MLFYDLDIQGSSPKTRTTAVLDRRFFNRIKMPKVEYSRLQDSDVELSSKYQRTFIARYYGRALVERWHTQTMLPWIIAEIQRLGSPNSETVFLSITECSIKATNVKFGHKVFEHKLGSVTKFNQLAESQRCFAYLTKEGSDVSLCHAFQASDDLAVFQLFTVLKEAIQESSIGIRAKEDSPMDAVQNKQCQQYEVLYVGKIKVSQKRGPQRFVDDTIEKIHSSQEDNFSDKAVSNIFKQPLETAKSKKKETEWASEIDHPLICVKETSRTNECKSSSGQDTLSSKKNLSPPPAMIPHTQSLDKSSRDALVQDIQTLAFTSEQFSSIIEDGSLHRQSSLPPINAKTFMECSLGFPFTQEDSSDSLSEEQNQTMLFLISPSDIRLISTDKKELLFQKDFVGISHCSQGEEHTDHFGIICRETTITGIDTFVGYIFQCQSAPIVNEIMKTFKQSFECAVMSSQEKRVLSKIFNFCNSCPMYWLHTLCSDIEGEVPEQVQSKIMMHIAALTDKEQKELMSKYQEIIVRSSAEQNIVFMTLLRALCEQKQMKHTHSLSKEKRTLSPLSNLTTMAKKTFPNTFDTVFKDTPLVKAYSLPAGARADFRPDKKTTKDTPKSKLTKTLSTVDSTKKEVSKQATPPLIDFSPSTDVRVHKESTSSLRCGTERSLSDTAAVIWDLHQNDPSKGKGLMTSSDVKINEIPRASFKASPLRNIFLRVGSKKGNFPLKEIKEQHGSKGSWRKMLFHRVQRPYAKDTIFGEIAEEKQMEPPKHSSSHLKALWKKAIMEQIMLIRLEREQKKLKAKQDKMLEKHTKLDYDVICPCPNDALQKWDSIILSEVPYSDLEAAVKYGIPRQKRGEIWLYLAKSYSVAKKCPATDSTAYAELMRKLTPYQHAILIDIGRTYPGHAYFKQVLGSGQLSLFSLLKAYSVVDEEVGYCQGLSFLGGILLLHLEEEKAFQAIKYMMFTLGLRNQYKSDMAALQVQMYQLARLIQNTVPDVHELFDKYEVSPMLYAAPWFLTLFASHFPIGFVSRLFDLIFLQGTCVLFKVSVLLLKVHQTQILKCNSFESIVSYLKTTLPSSGHVGMEKVLDQVLSLDIEKPLVTYQIEYSVLKEEMGQLGPETEVILPVTQALEKEKNDLQKQNMELTEQLQVAGNTVSKLEASVMTYTSTIRKLEAHVHTMQDERDALLHSVNVLRKRLDLLEDAAGKNTQQS